MYKMMILLKKSAEEEFVNHFKNNILTTMEDLTGSKLTVAEIEGAAMMEEPYNKICEINFNSKREMDEIFVSPKGKKFNRELTSMMNFISIFFINYEK